MQIGLENVLKEIKNSSAGKKKTFHFEFLNYPLVENTTFLYTLMCLYI